MHMYLKSELMQEDVSAQSSHHTYVQIILEL